MQDRTIQILISQHNLIVSLLNEASHEGIRTKEGKKSFDQARKIIRKHLELEHLRLYPKLKEQAQFAPLAKQYHEDLFNLAAYMESTFKHHENGYYPLEFAEDMEYLIHLLDQQFQREEMDLFHLYNRDIKARAA